MSSSYLEEEIYLIGRASPQITGGQLPTNLQALQVLFFNTRVCRLKLEQSFQLVIKEISIFWEKAGIPIQDVRRCIKKLDSLYDEYRKVQKSCKSQYGEKSEAKFQERLTQLFDISHGNAMKMIDESRKAFLTDQRSKRLIECIRDIHQETNADSNIHCEIEDQELILEDPTMDVEDPEPSNVDPEPVMASKQIWTQKFIEYWSSSSGVW
ncbi:hypothetical protein QAD02_012611 [Eretmocerus hayati]|uniref:Uncharacterized protein n=1 Tax=Eretmocerus hayati TaxID=131215 RepID=A0ACC2NZZ1_9HYME|nr:hypothetical protein QAD02_012611 [Eretmocerus hayati]